MAAVYTFGEGIEIVLDKISLSDTDRQLYTKHAEIIQNEFVEAISRRDPLFRQAFEGLSLGGSYLDDIKIDLPDEFDMHIKINVGCTLKPIAAPKHRGFVFLKVQDRIAHPCIVNGFVDRERMQEWFRTNISDAMEDLQHIDCDNDTYFVKYIGHGYGVAHSIIATNSGNRGQRIKFDFVPVFEFNEEDWPSFSGRPSANRTWFAVPRKFMGTSKDDTRSFMLCAPHWERLALSQKQNLKDSLRLLKAFRNANNMPRLVSYMLKTVYLNKLSENVDSIDWNQSPGRILIRILKNLLGNLRKGRQSFFLDPEHNNFSDLDEETIQNYKRTVARFEKNLIKRRDADYFTTADLHDFFGIDIN